MSRFPLFPLSCLGLLLAGCDAPRVSIDGHTGVPLAQLDLAGQTAHDITLLGPDTVHIVHGDALAIRVDGDARASAALRFVLNDGKLGIGRQPDANAGNGTATVTITDPAVDHMVMAGSGTMSNDRLVGNAVGVTIGGSGHVVIAGIAATQLDVEVLGSGSFTGSGRAGKVALTLAGSGDVDLAQLRTDEAVVDVAGTGTGVLNSDGRVTGSVLGTGVVNVHGKAHCDIRVTGVGRVTCQP
ncbi:GIN domain-containing protein [Novosphingobium sp.]|uniref:GIN domain-containing protein n=1 Tax=Novosphingobium sp. TaxID=1874826 RepID=UPI003D0C78FC